MGKRVIISGGIIVMCDDQADTYEVNFLPMKLGEDNFVTLKFQNGAIPERGNNGLTNELLVEIVMDRIRRLNASLPNDRSKMALFHLARALEELNIRSSERAARGVEGKKIA